VVGDDFVDLGVVVGDSEEEEGVEVGDLEFLGDREAGDLKPVDLGVVGYFEGIISSSFF
jgi:hypothetical protein